MKPFGINGLSYSHGYDLPVLVSHLEGLLDSEVDECHSGRGGGKKVMKRIELVEAALQKLDEAMDLGGES